MKLGISSYSLTWSIGVPGYDTPKYPLSVTGLLHKAAENEISLVQIADNIPLHTLNLTQYDEILATSNEIGIEIEVGTRGTDPEHLLNYLHIAKRLGARLVRTLITTLDIAEAQWHLAQVMPQFEKAGVCIAIENHGLHKTKQLSTLFDNIGSPMVGCCLDTVNSFSALENPDRVIADLVPYILNLHIKDFDVTRVDHQMGFLVLGTPAGHGKLNIPRLLETVRSQGKNPTAILELWTPFTRTVEETVELENEWFNQSLTYLKTLDFTYR